MKHYFYSAIVLSTLILSLLLPSPSAAEEIKYTFGVVPQFEARKLHAIWKPILEELEKRTGFTFEMIGTPDITSFERSYIAGRYDFAYMNPYHAMLAFDKHGYRPVVRDGSRQLYGVLVVPKNSSLTIADLEGKEVGFPSPNALGASLLIRADLDRVYNINVKPVFLKTHSSVYLNVALGKVDAGGGVAATLKLQKPEIREKLKMIYETSKVPPHHITALSKIPTEHIEKIRQAFLDMEKTEHGSKLLKAVPMAKPVKATEQDYQILRNLSLEKYWMN